MPRRLALLVATYHYQDAGLSQLTAPGNDAEALERVLLDPEIANFEVTTLINQPLHVVGDAISKFYHDRRRDDLTLLYFTGHGLKDEQGRLYLAMTNTTRDHLLFTGLSTQQIADAMEACSSRQKVLVLDCCYSGAFPTGHMTKADHQVNTLEKFQGKGRVVLTASDAIQYAFEGSRVVGEATQSVFTRFLVEGLATGKADLDRDGNICLDELYNYTYERVIEERPEQRPKKIENVEGRIVIAHNIHWTLPDHLVKGIASPFPQERRVALDLLANEYHKGNDLVRAEVFNHIRHLAQDDSKLVSSAAMQIITLLDPDADQREPEAPRWVPAAPSGLRHSSAGEKNERRVATLPARLSTSLGTSLGTSDRTSDTAGADPPAPVTPSDVGRPRQIQIASSARLALAVALVFVMFLATGRLHFGSTAEPEPAPITAPSAALTNGPEGPIPALGPTIPVGQTPGFVAVSPNGHHAYIANQDTQRITVLDTAVNQVTATIPIPAGPPQFLAFAPDGRRLYVSIFNDQGTIHLVDVIDTSSNTVVATIPQPARPFLPAVTRDGKLLYVPNHDIASVSVVDTASNTVIANIKVAPHPHWVAFSPDDRWAYTANHESNLVSVIDTTTREVVTTIPVGTSPHSLAVNPTRPLVANVNYDANSVTVIDTNTRKVVATISVGNNPQDIVWAPDGRFAYVVNEGSNTVSVIDAATDQVTATLPTGAGPTSIAVLPNGRQAYVSNLGSGTLTILNLTG
ncbi:MAG: caspase, EACC1-associated type [Pseudonocardiaceae bacterium]